MVEKFEDRSFSGQITLRLKVEGKPDRIWTADKTTLIKEIVQIVRRYAADNYVMTLRQLYYQLVKANVIPNHDTAYKKISSILDDCRYGGIIDWNAIEDRGRVPYEPFNVDSISEGLQLIADQYRRNRQQDQKVHVEVWTEKDAISNILKRVCNKYGVMLCVNKGYTSSSAIHQSYERIAQLIKSDKKVSILYFGDHDPSGLDMVRDIRERLLFFLSKGRLLQGDSDFENKVTEWWREKKNTWYDLQGFLQDTEFEKMMRWFRAGEDVVGDDKYSAAIDWFYEGRMRMYIEQHDLFSVTPIGLTREQITRFDLPPNPAKITDPRARDYIREHGPISWEVDALEPRQMIRIVESHIEQIIDLDQYQKIMDEEKRENNEIKSLVKKYAQAEKKKRK